MKAKCARLVMTMTVAFVCLALPLRAIRLPQVVAQTVTERAVYVLNPERALAVAAENNGVLSAPDGALCVFSSSLAAVRTRHNGQIQVKTLRLNEKGGAVVDSHIVASDRVRLTEMKDPLADVEEPNAAGLRAFGEVELSTGQVRLQPGVYESLIISGLAQVTLAPGVYVVKNGIEVTSGGSIVGQGVTLANDSKLFMESVSKLTLSAPTDGALRGIAYFQRRTNKETVRLEGAAQVAVNGTVYVPGGYVHVTGNGVFTCTRLIADSVKVIANGRLMVR